jgi:O-acetyl-ADP-ribose deacetylase (regulator of RNase III)
MCPVRVVHGDLFESSLQTLTNTINTVGVMGAGIAKEFKARYPAMFEDYKRRCGEGLVRAGEPYLWQSGEGKAILNFPTKEHWRGKSQMIWIEQGLDFLSHHYLLWRIESLALPALGCSHGGLAWLDVRAVMERYLSALDIPIEIYEPLPGIESTRRSARKKKASSQKKLF